MRACRSCGCTDDRACIDDFGRACSWATTDLCTACVADAVVLEPPC